MSTYIRIGLIALAKFSQTSTVSTSVTPGFWLARVKTAWRIVKLWGAGLNVNRKSCLWPANTALHPGKTHKSHKYRSVFSNMRHKYCLLPEILTLCIIYIKFKITFFFRNWGRRKMHRKGWKNRGLQKPRQSRSKWQEDVERKRYSQGFKTCGALRRREVCFLRLHHLQTSDSCKSHIWSRLWPP